MNPRESQLQAKKEGDPNYRNDNTNPKIPSSSRRWSVHKNPRIVRVSRTFGGKDRHSKVCTVRGLRDRRIRLSVPTAIQLYDLQDRLGLGQPSKVVDWLLEATKNDIDKLPPLPTLPLFTHLSHPPLVPNPQPHFLTAKDLGIVPTKDGIKTSENGEGLGGFEAQNLFQLGNQSVFPSMPYNPYNFHLDHPNMVLSQFGGGFPNFPNVQTDHDHHQSHNTLLSSFLPSTSHLYFSPSSTTVSSHAVPSFPYSINNESRQINHSLHVQQSPLLPTTLNLISPNVSSHKHIYPPENDHNGRSSRKDNKES